jgi:RNA polymerase sigma factor (sigma-70 family)
LEKVMNGDRAADPAGETSLHVRLAVDGQSGDLEWLVQRFTPWLLAAAADAMGDQLQRVYDPADVVSHVWLVLLPKLPTITARDGRVTPSLLRFMDRVLSHYVNNLLRDELKKMHGAPQRKSDLGDPMDRLPADTVTAVSRIVHQEYRGAVYAALRALSPMDRTILLMRWFHQIGTETAASVLQISPESARTRFHRAKKRLQEKLRGMAFDDLFDS